MTTKRPRKRRVTVLARGYSAGAHFWAGLVFATLAVLPFLETLLFNIHVCRGQQRLSRENYQWFFVLSLVLWFFMVVCFNLEKADFTRWLDQLRHFAKHSHGLLTLLKRLWFLLPIVLVPLAVIYLVAGSPIAAHLFGIARDELVSEVVAVVSAPVLVWAATLVLKSLSKSSAEDLREAIDSWKFGLWLSVLFYLLLIYATWRQVAFESIQRTARLNFELAVPKDYFLLFIIVGMLYLGLFKVGRAHKLVPLFRTKSGFLLFCLICAVIAVYAVHADFSSMTQVVVEHAFYYDWQGEYYVAHVYLRDILLLLLPIAGLLLWTLSRVADEIHELKEKAVIEGASAKLP